MRSSAAQGRRRSTAPVERRSGTAVGRFVITGLLFCVCLALVGCGTVVPDMKGKTISQAEKVILDAGFKIGIVDYDQKPAGTAGLVVSQTPKAGDRANGGLSVSLTVSGSPPVATPVLVGLERTKAEVTLKGIGLILGTVTESYDVSLTAGAVTTQTPAPGTDVDKGSAVGIIVSKGPEPVKIPTVVGKTEADAKRRLAAAGFTVKVATKNDSAAKGIVTAQSPSKGTARPGTAVAIDVSIGVELVRVPTVIGMYPNDAGARLRSAGLGVNKVAVHGPLDSDSSNAGFGMVYRQTPKAGARVPKGTEVEIRSWWELG